MPSKLHFKATIDLSLLFKEIIIMNNVDLLSSQIGTIVEYKCITHLLELGYNVLKPIGEYFKYDFGIDIDGKFYRIQCKHATKKDRSFVIKTCMSHRDGKRYTYSKKDCDFFMTEFEGKFYILPVSNSISKRVWIETPKNKLKSCCIGKDYIASDVLKGL
jgi:hypothetical protein